MFYNRTVTWFSCNQLSHCGGVHTNTDLSNVVGHYLEGKYGKWLFKSCPFPWLSYFCTRDVVTRSRSGEAVAAALPTALEAFCWWCWCREGAWWPTPLQSWAACLWVWWWVRGALFLLTAKLLLWAHRGVTEGMILPRDSQDSEAYLLWVAALRRWVREGKESRFYYCERELLLGWANFGCAVVKPLGLTLPLSLRASLQKTYLW